VDGTQCVSPGLHEGAKRVIDSVGQFVEGGRGNGELFCEGAVVAAPDANFEAVFADVLVPAQATAAGAAAEHGVTCDAAAEPPAVNTVPDGGHCPAPPVAEPPGEFGVALVKIL